MLQLAKEGLRFLRENPLVPHVILFMAGVNFIASSFDAVLPALVIPRRGNGTLGIVTACSGAAMILGSLLASVMPKPKDRVRMIYLTMLFSLGTENFLLAFSRKPLVWCVGQVLGWILAPVMSANQNVILRNTIPVFCRGGCSHAETRSSFLRSRSAWPGAVSWWIMSVSRLWLRTDPHVG